MLDKLNPLGITNVLPLTFFLRPSLSGDYVLNWEDKRRERMNSWYSRLNENAVPFGQGDAEVAHDAKILLSMSPHGLLMTWFLSRSPGSIASQVLNYMSTLTQSLFLPFPHLPFCPSLGGSADAIAHLCSLEIKLLLRFNETLFPCVQRRQLQFLCILLFPASLA